MFSVMRYFSIATILLSYLSAVRALPLDARQNGDPVTVHTVHSTTTPVGPMIQTCVITLTPITDKNGNPAVEEVSKCTLAPDNNSSSGSTSNGSNNGSGSSNNGSGSSNNGESGGNSSSSTRSATTAATQAATSEQTTSTARSSSSASSTSTATKAEQTSPSNTGNSGNSGNNGNSNGTANTNTAAGSSQTQASDNQSPAGSAEAAQVTTSATSALAAAAVPGKSLNVLPIGLGVFAGISVIALIVVGLVTYERTKYRKAFRQRKLAESGAAMGYGGMAQRS